MESRKNRAQLKSKTESEVLSECCSATPIKVHPLLKEHTYQSVFKLIIVHETT